MKKYLFMLFIFCSLFSKGQNPLVKMWDKDFGGTDDDCFFFIQQTEDSGFILGGYSRSGISGNKTQATRGNFDYWIVKTDSLGNKQWDKDFGGDDDDLLYSIQQTADGGFILGGASRSGISGDKTQLSWGVDDYWIVKTDSLGNKQWDKDFGGLTFDKCYSIQQTMDGGFILGGFSLSGVGGDKTQANWDTSGITADYWIIKTDSLGNKQWDKSFGGADYDVFFSIQQTADNGFILGGYSLSGISGDKTQALWGGAGDVDYWIVKTDPLGNKQWDKDFGGTSIDYLASVQQTADGGFIVGGQSNSGINGDKTQSTWGNHDYWIVKTDSLGNKQWDRDFGGTGGEELHHVFQTTDGGYLLSGDSYSPFMGGDKTENNLGSEQTWVLKTDSLGTMLWENTLLTYGHDENAFAVETRDGCYVIANMTYSMAVGDKSQSTWGAYDYWMIKFCETLQAGFTSPSYICPGTCTDFVNLSFNATSYHWNFFGASPDTSTAINPTGICYATPGVYNVQLIASNANGSDTLLLTNYIIVYPSPPPQAITQSGDTLFAIAGSATYQWYFNTNIINGATNYFYVAPASGDYNVVATDANGCEVEAAVFNVVASVGAIEDQGILIFPNPVGEKLTVIGLPAGQAGYQLSETATEISIYNVMGERTYISAYREPITVNCEHFPSGLYYIEIKIPIAIGTEKTFRTKFVKQ